MTSTGTSACGCCRRPADMVVVRVHGLERYIQKDFSDGTAGEFILDLHLQRAGDRWTVVRTDETTLSEFHSSSP